MNEICRARMNEIAVTAGISKEQVPSYVMNKLILSVILIMGDYIPGEALP